MIDIHDEPLAEMATVGNEEGIVITTAASLWANNDGLEEVAGPGDDEHGAAAEAEERGISTTAIFAADDNVAAGTDDEDEGRAVVGERSEATTALFDGESGVGNEDEVAVAVVEAASAAQEYRSSQIAPRKIITGWVLNGVVELSSLETPPWLPLPLNLS